MPEDKYITAAFNTLLKCYKAAEGTEAERAERLAELLKWVADDDSDVFCYFLRGMTDYVLEG